MRLNNAGGIVARIYLVYRLFVSSSPVHPLPPFLLACESTREMTISVIHECVGEGYAFTASVSYLQFPRKPRFIGFPKC